MHDQAGAREGMYYRQFRCKGKGKGKCTTSYTHEDFLALATRQLGQNQINEIKSECAFTFSPVKPSSGKRMHDGTSTGLTPMHKRVVSRTTLRNSPPVFSSVFPDCVEKSSVKPFCRVSKYQEIDSLRLNLQKAEVMNEILQEKLIQKDEYISMLREQIQILTMSQASVAVRETRSVTPVLPRSPSLQVPCTPPYVPSTPSHESLPSSYAAIVASPIQILRSPPKVDIVPDCRGRLKIKYDLSIVYFIGLRQQKIGGFRKEAKSLGLCLRSVQNISFIGKSIAEFLVDSSSQQALVNQAKSLGYNVRIDLDVTAKTRDNPIWIEYGHEGSSLNDVIKSNFIRRISHEIKTIVNERARLYYMDWADVMGWKESLLLTSTRLSSP